MNTSTVTTHTHTYQQAVVAEEEGGEVCEGPQLRAEVLDGPSNLQPGPQRLAALRLLAGHDGIVSLGGLVGSLRPSHRIFCTTWLREGGAGGGGRDVGAGRVDLWNT